MSVRLKAIILRRKPAGDESLYLDTLLENGEFGAFRIPGIMKSAKRSSFHYAPGGIYDIIFQGSTSLATGASSLHRIIPKSSELIFSPYTETQDYRTLSAVAEIVQIADFVKSSGENAELFSLMANALTQLSAASLDLDRHLDSYYWNFLGFLGLAGDAGEEEYEAYDLASGFLTARELAERPKADFVLPYAWVTRAASPPSPLHNVERGAETESPKFEINSFSPSPYSWRGGRGGEANSAACRETIRKYLKSI